MIFKRSLMLLLAGIALVGAVVPASAQPDRYHHHPHRHCWYSHGHRHCRVS